MQRNTMGVLMSFMLFATKAYAAGGAQQQGSLTGMIMPLVLMVVIFYFLIIRPQKKKQKAHDDMIAGISVGDQVITAGGFFGVVRKVLDDSYLIELDEGVKARILKSSIQIKKSDTNTVSYKPEKKKRKKAEEAQTTPEVKAEAPEVQALPETQAAEEKADIAAE